MAPKIAVIVLSITLLINGYQTLDVNKFVNNVKPIEAYKKLQTEVNKTQKQIKEQLLPNQIEKSDEFELNKHSKALKEIDDKVKNYQSNQGSSVIQPLITNQLLPNHIEKLDELESNKHFKALKEIDDKVKNYQSNQGSSVIQPLITNPLLPNHIEKLDEFESNKHSESLKGIDEKVKNYQSNQGSSVIQPLISNQLLPNHIEKLYEIELNKHSDALKDIDEKVKNYKSNQGSSVIQPLISNQQPNYQQIVQDKLKVINPLRQPIGLSPQSKPTILGQQTQLFEGLNHQLIDTLVKNHLPVIPNQQIGQLFDQLQKPDQQSFYENPQLRQIAMNVFNHRQNQDQPLFHLVNQYPGQHHSLFNQQPNHQSVFNTLPFNHHPSIFGLVNQVTHPNRQAGSELLSIGQNLIDFMNKAPILPYKDNIIYILLNNLGMSKENTMVIPVQL